MKKLFTLLLLTFTVSTAFSQMSKAEVEFTLRDVFPEMVLPKGTVVRVYFTAESYHLLEVDEHFKMELRPEGFWCRSGLGATLETVYVPYPSIATMLIHRYATYRDDPTRMEIMFVVD
jgi:hypothetical protein